MKVFKFGLRAPDRFPPGVPRDPERGQRLRELAMDQLWLRHRYYCDLLEVHRGRRAAERERELALGLDVATRDLAAATDRCKAALKAAKAARAAQGVRRNPPEHARAVAAAKAARKEARAALRAKRADLREQTQADRDAIGERFLAMRRSLRRHYSKILGLRHGTYTAVEAAVDAACRSTPLWDTHGNPSDPRFPAYTGEGSIGVQVQGGMSVDELLGGAHRQVQLSITGSRRSGKEYGVLRVRVGSDANRDPIWAEWPIVLHRRFPLKARIKRVMVSRRMTGTTEHWSTEFTVDDSASGPAERCGDDVVAMDLGWRRESEALRVVAWRDERGNHGLLRLDPAVLERLQKADGIRAVRDKNMLAAVQTLCAQLGGMALPPWFREQTSRRSKRRPTSAQALARVRQWSSQRRLARLCLRWRRNRFDGDEAAFDALEAWRKRDKHLWNYEAGCRRHALNDRREAYRVFGARMARTYRVVVFERFDLRSMATKPTDGSRDDHQSEAARKSRHRAAPSEVRRCIADAFRSRGGEVVAVPAAWSTQDCPACGYEQVWDAAASITRRPPCPRCGCELDQDDGACIVLLRRYRERHPDGVGPGGARNPDKPGTQTDGRESKWQRVARMRAEKRDRMATSRKPGATPSK